MDLFKLKIIHSHQSVFVNVIKILYENENSELISTHYAQLYRLYIYEIVNKQTKETISINNCTLSKCPSHPRRVQKPARIKITLSEIVNHGDSKCSK